MSLILVFQYNVNNLILEQGYTQHSFSKKSKISKMTINKVMSKDANCLKLNTAILIAKALNVDFPSLFSRLSKPINEYSEHNFLENFITNTKTTLDRRNKTRKSLSCFPGVSPSTISDILNKNTNNPKLSSLNSIAESLEIDLKILFQKGIK